jgi:hypothetical protein
VLPLNECLLLQVYISLPTQSGNFWIYPRASSKLEQNNTEFRHFIEGIVVLYFFFLKNYPEWVHYWENEQVGPHLTSPKLLNGILHTI